MAAWNERKRETILPWEHTVAIEDKNWELMAVEAVMALVFDSLVNSCSSSVWVVLPSGMLLLPSALLLTLDF